jgi:hypothetical protein
MVNFSTPSDPIIALNRKHYLSYFVGYPGAAGGWDTNDDPSTVPLPANASLVTPDGRFVDDAGTHIGTFIHGGSSVEDVVNKAWAIAPTGKIPIAYWDGPWPSWPVNLPPMSWLCIWAYCRKEMSPTQMESWLRAVIAEPNRPQLPLVIVTQGYTSNNDMTKDIASLVAPYSRVVRDTPSAIGTLVFNGNGRTGGLQHNQHVVPLWGEYFAGITGKPDTGEPDVPQPPPDNGIVNGQCINPKHYFQSLTWDKPPSEYRAVIEQLKEDYWKYGWGFQTRTPAPGDDLGEPTSRFYLPCAGCPNAAPVTPEDKRFGVRQDHACWDAGCVVDTIENDSAGNPIAWTWVERGPQAYQPIPAPDVPEVPGEVAVLIHEYDQTVQRSDPHGCLVRLEAASTRPIVRISLWLDDGERPLHAFFHPPYPPDGRYFRAIAFKPVVNGTFKLIAEAEDDQGNVGRSDGTETVTVVP